MLQCLQSCATRWCRGEENDCIRRGRVASRYFQFGTGRRDRAGSSIASSSDKVDIPNDTHSTKWDVVKFILYNYSIPVDDKVRANEKEETTGSTVTVLSSIERSQATDQLRPRAIHDGAASILLYRWTRLATWRRF